MKSVLPSRSWVNLASELFAVLDLWLDSIILKVFVRLNDSVKGAAFPTFATCTDDADVCRLQPKCHSLSYVSCAMELWDNLQDLLLFSFWARADIRFFCLWGTPIWGGGAVSPSEGQNSSFRETPQMASAPLDHMSWGNDLTRHPVPGWKRTQ